MACVHTALLHQPETVTTGDFLDEFGNFLFSDNIQLENVLVVSDFNFQMAKPNDPHTWYFVLLYSQLGFDKFFTQPKHVKGHTLDIILSRVRKLVKSITVENMYLSDHFFLVIGTDLLRPRVLRKVVKRRNVKGIDRSQFQGSCSVPSSNNIDDLVDLYNVTLLDLLNKLRLDRRSCYLGEAG